MTTKKKTDYFANAISRQKYLMLFGGAVFLAVACLISQILQPHPQDGHTYFSWMTMAAERGLLNIYEWSSEEVMTRFQEFNVNYPAFIFLYYPFARVLMKLGLWNWPSVSVNLLFRIPLFLFHFAIFLRLDHWIEGKKYPDRRLWLFLLLLINPALLVAGPVWIQFNFVLWGAAAISLIEYANGAALRSGMWAALAFIVKPQFVLFLPLYGFLFVRHKPRKNIFVWLGGFSAAAVILLSPFLVTTGLDCIRGGYTRVSGGYAVADIGYNFWWTLIKGLKLSNQNGALMGVPFNHIGIVVSNALVGILGIFYCFTKRKISLLSLSAASFLILFCFMPGMNAHCLVPALSFLCLWAVFEPKLRPWAILLSLLQAANLAYAALWVPGTRFFLHISPVIAEKIGLLCALAIFGILLVCLKAAFTETGRVYE